MLGVPCIFLTASKQPGLRDQARRLGAAGFFEKPTIAEALLATIRATLEAPADEGDLPRRADPDVDIDETATLPVSSRRVSSPDHAPTPQP